MDELLGVAAVKAAGDPDDEGQRRPDEQLDHLARLAR